MISQICIIPFQRGNAKLVTKYEFAQDIFIEFSCDTLILEYCCLTVIRPDAHVLDTLKL